MTEVKKIDVRKLRAVMLANFGRYAEEVLTEKSGLESVMLCCSQFYADEAGDAVHDNIRASKQLLPIDEAKRQDDYSLRAKHMRWDSNGEAVFAFSPHCSEEGASPWAQPSSGDEEDEEYWEGGAPSQSPLALAQRIDGKVQLTWLGFPHRPWLDFPNGLANRDEYFEETPPQFLEDPRPAALVGEEVKLHAQVLEQPHELGPRQVLCDLWAQRGDPRGEFGALCFSGKRTQKVLSQAARLVLAHGREWLGPLTKVIPGSGALFGDGPFLQKAVVHFDAKTFKALGNDPHWATVKSLTFVGEHGGLTPAMQQVLEVGPLKASQLAPLEQGTWRVRALEVVADKPAVLVRVAALALPLERLSIRAGTKVDLAPLRKAGYFGELRELELWLPSATSEVAIGLGEAMKALEAVAPTEAQPKASGNKVVLRAGVLSPGGRTGWVLERDGQGKRTLRLLQPDERLEEGPALAQALKVSLDASWTPADDWLHFGLGASRELT